MEHEENCVAGREAYNLLSRAYVGEGRMTEEAGGQEDLDGALIAITDGIGDLVTGVPAPIRKNAWKAFTRLCTAAVDYPVALIEGATAEKRAESKARVKLINVSANQIAQQMQTNPEYARAAASKYAQKIIRERVNLDQIAEMAADELKDPAAPGISSFPTPDSTQETTISDDWLNVFESEACNMSSDEMQRLFAKILAGEIQKPASYSIRTLKLVAQLDDHVAKLFRRLCSLSVSFRDPSDVREVFDARVVFPSDTDSIEKYGLSFDALMTLQEYGLLISEFQTFAEYGAAVDRGQGAELPITYENKSWSLLPKDKGSEPKPINLHGAGFSRAAKELLPIVEIDHDETYSEMLRRIFESYNVVLTPLLK